MSLLDVLLQTDLGTIEQEMTVEIEVPRLSKIFGEPFILTVKAVDPERYMQLQSQMVDVGTGKASDIDIDLYNFYIHLLVEGITNSEFNDPKVLTKFGAATPIDIYKKLFNSGEISKIALKISSLSGYDQESNSEVVEEVKN